MHTNLRLKMSHIKVESLYYERELEMMKDDPILLKEGGTILAKMNGAKDRWNFATRNLELCYRDRELLLLFSFRVASLC